MFFSGDETLKLCIVTRIDYRNYGNRLQNYALQKLLEEENWEVLSGLQINSKEEWEKNSKGSVRIIKHYLPFFIYRLKIMRERKAVDIDHRNDYRWRVFRQFTDDHIPTLPYLVVRDRNHLSSIMNKYEFDYFVAGSDQVWNPIFGGRDYEFLSFAPYSKRLSFAASFGVSLIPNNRLEEYKTLLSGMRYISVREEEGVRIINELTGRQDVDLTLDPTLLLERDYWEELILECSIAKPSHYIVTYFLGEEPKAVNEFAEKVNLPVMRLNSIKNYVLNNCGPIEFLSILHDAEYVLTDSFHGLAFSIKFNKEFYIFRRKDSKSEDMFGRITSLTNMLGFEKRIQERGEVTLLKPISKGRWEEVNVYLLERKKESMKRFRLAMISGK